MTASVVNLKGATAALVAAVLFGLSAPFAKLLLPATGPLMLAALLYLGAGLGLAVVSLLAARQPATDATPREAPLRRAEVHAHWHVHELLEHEHAHVHDEHHRHEHREVELGRESHAHVHSHLPLSHAHPHVSDVHHRHRH